MIGTQQRMAISKDILAYCLKIILLYYTISIQQRIV